MAGRYTKRQANGALRMDSTYLPSLHKEQGRQLVMGSVIEVREEAGKWINKNWRRLVELCL